MISKLLLTVACEMKSPKMGNLVGEMKDFSYESIFDVVGGHETVLIVE